MITPLLNDCKISPWAQLCFIWFLHVFLVEPDGYQEASILWWPCYLLQVFGTDVAFCASWRSPEKGFKWWLLQLSVKVFWGGFFIANPEIFKYVWKNNLYLHRHMCICLKRIWTKGDLFLKTGLDWWFQIGGVIVNHPLKWPRNSAGDLALGCSSVILKVRTYLGPSKEFLVPIGSMYVWYIYLYEWLIFMGSMHRVPMVNHPMGLGH